MSTFYLIAVVVSSLRRKMNIPHFRDFAARGHEPGDVESIDYELGDCSHRLWTSS